MKIEFEHLKIHGFLSISDDELDLSDQGIVKVSGVNNSSGSSSSNGSGKSSIFEALYYALTGKTIRETTDIVNIYDETGYAEVTLTLSVDGHEYIIKRTKNHPDYGNNLFINKDGNDISGDKLKKTEEVLRQELPKVDSDLITSVIILGQGLPNRFTSLTPMKRKERLEDLAETSEFIQSFRQKVSQASKNNVLSLTNEKMNNSGISSRLDRNNELLVEKSKKLDKYEKSDINPELLSNELANKKAKLSTLDSERKAVQDSITELNEEYSSMNTKYYQMYVNQISQYKVDGSKLYTKKNDLLNSKVCPTCKRPYDESTIEAIDDNARELDDQMQTLLNNISKLTEDSILYKDKVNQKKTELDEAKVKLQNFPSTVELINEITKMSNKLSEYNLATTSLKDEIVDLQHKIQTDKEDLKGSNGNIKVLENKDSVLSYLNKISNKEFRSYMLKGIINYLNTRISYYGKILFGNSSLEMNLDDKGRLYIKYDSRQYESLSGGEKQRADIATQFSIRDMLLYGLGFSCNLVVLDESFDNLDDSGVTSLLNLITSMSDLNSIYIVSHHSELPIPFDTKINVLKGLDNISVLEKVHG